MKLEDIKIGMKVVPHSRYGNNNFCSLWKQEKEVQGYLYVNVIKKKEGLVALHINNSFPQGNYYLPSDIEPYQEPTMTITQEQFDNLKEGDVVNNKYNGDLFFQGKIGKVSFWVNSSGYSNTLFLADLQNLDYSLVTKPENYQGFILGDYSDKIVVVAVSNTSTKDCQKMEKIGILSHVGKDYFALKGMVTKWTYAQLINTTPFQLV